MLLKLAGNIFRNQIGRLVRSNSFNLIGILSYAASLYAHDHLRWACFLLIDNRSKSIRNYVTFAFLWGQSNW
jgi:hypothetical protein